MAARHYVPLMTCLDVALIPMLARQSVQEDFAVVHIRQNSGIRARRCATQRLAARWHAPVQAVETPSSPFSQKPSQTLHVFKAKPKNACIF